MLSQYAVGLSHGPSQPAFFFPPYRDPGGMLSRHGRMPSRNDKSPPAIWNTHGIPGNVFVIHRRLLRHLIQEDSILGFLT